MFKRILATFAAGILIAVTAVSVSGSQASAADWISNFWSTKTSDGTGFANMNVDIKFTDQGRGLRVRGSVTDRCPGDGKGAYGRIIVHYVGGGFEDILYGELNDTNGCGAAGSGTKYTFYEDFNHRIDYVGFEICEVSGDTDGSGRACDGGKEYNY